MKSLVYALNSVHGVKISEYELKYDDITVTRTPKAG